MGDSHGHISEDRMFFMEQQQVLLKPIAAAGWILDIGGGGEGIMGQLMGSQCVAIDPNQRELEEAGPGPLKIVMDAREMQFLDDSFGAATVFFTLMYLKAPDDVQSVLSETFRVLEPGGALHIWDVATPPRGDDKRDILVIPIQATLPDRVIDTGYGQPWTNDCRDAAFYIEIARAAGFQTTTHTPNGQTFYLEFRKPE